MAKTDRMYHGPERIVFGNVSVRVTTAPDAPVLTFAGGTFGAPRQEFVHYVVKRELGLQDNGDRHGWDFLEEAKPERVEDPMPVVKRVEPAGVDLYNYLVGPENQD